MTLKVRKDLQTPMEEFQNILKERKKAVSTRKELTSNVDYLNSKLITELRGLLRPIAKKVGLGFTVSIEDENTRILVPVQFIKNNNPYLYWKLSFTVDPLQKVGCDKDLKKILKSIEKYLRLSSRSLKDSKSCPVRPDNFIVVSINTRNKYFE